jgi:hypothetical protein
MAAPEFPTPMSYSLRERGQEFVLPGLDKLPPETVTVVKANNRFINSFMIGLNHEMSRQLLWRGYATDQRGTYFRQFWDPSSRVAPPGETTPPDLHDLSRLDQWLASRLLRTGEGASASGGDLVLVVRGELLRRFPDAIVSAVEATPTAPPGLGTSELFPVFTGGLPPDVRFYGFDLRFQDALTGGSGNAGYFFVIQEHPTEPRFGLVEAADPSDPNAVNLPGKSPATWRDLSWAHLCNNQAELDALTYAPADLTHLAQPITPTVDPSPPAWGTNSADMAAVSLRDPVRLAIYAPPLLK